MQYIRSFRLYVRDRPEIDPRLTRDRLEIYLTSYRDQPEIARDCPKSTRQPSEVLDRGGILSRRVSARVSHGYTGILYAMMDTIFCKYAHTAVSAYSCILSVQYPCILISASICIQQDVRSIRETEPPPPPLKPTTPPRSRLTSW